MLQSVVRRNHKSGSYVDRDQCLAKEPVPTGADGADGADACKHANEDALKMIRNRRSCPVSAKFPTANALPRDPAVISPQRPTGTQFG